MSPSFNMLHIGVVDAEKRSIILTGLGNTSKQCYEDILEQMKELNMRAQPDLLHLWETATNTCGVFSQKELDNFNTPMTSLRITIEVFLD